MIAGKKIALLTTLVLLNAAAFGAWLWVRPWYEYALPSAFWLLILIPVLSLHYFLFENDRHAMLKFTRVSALRSPATIFYSVLPHLFFAIRLVAIWFCVIALARPQSKTDFESSDIEGIDIMLAIDVSESMLAKDFQPNRLESAKKVAVKFVEGRPDDRIGLVVFQAEAFTQVPLTTDHRVLKNATSELRSGLLESGTAIGMGLATAVNRLKESTARSKVIILLTDGVSNRGSINPLDAAAMAKTFGIRVYTIGAGTTGQAYQPVQIRPDGSYIYDYVDVEIDEEVLTKIAEITGGKYYRATSEKKLQGVYHEIDELEKTKFNVTQFSRRAEEFERFLFPGLVILFASFFIHSILLPRTP
ncbi:MAG: VWA domain-containing protein [Flavobacteriales bacterium]|nr:VWA domain-containing protein [Flavobacteriales bacterium]